MKIFTSLYIIVSFIILTNKNVVFSMFNVEKSVETLSNKLRDFVRESTSYEKFQEKVTTLHNDGILQVKTLNVAEVNREFNNNLRNLLVSRINSVKAIKKKAESLYNNYTYNENIQPFDYRNDKKLPNTSVRDEPTYSIIRKVNLNQSHVQFPTNIYEYDKKILNDAKWSEGLDSVFLKNFKREPSLLWQYVGTNNGIFRLFPGTRQEDVVLDKYDCRRRLWYSQAINSPKDVLIALDQSGSMTGSNFNIGKLTVKSLIDTLQQEDFFNVITFGDETNFIIPCLTTLRQATTRKKDAIKTAVDNLPSPKGISNVKIMLQRALNILQQDKSNYQTSSGCTRVLLLVSDGIEGESEVHKLLDALNQQAEIAVFSFQIGKNQPTNQMREMACDHGGEYYEFPTIGNVWNRVLKYQNVLSYPVAKSKQEIVVFTPLYLDGSGLGMMTTIAVGAFSDKGNTSDNSLIGVAGIDITTTILQQQAPAYKLGIFGHAFAINNNGLFLIHPRFRDQTGHLADPATVYLNEIEHTTDPSKSMKIMKEMIDDKTGCMDAELNWLYMNDIKRSVRLNATYCYRPANGTPFSTGVSIPLHNQKYLEPLMSNKEAYLQNRYLINGTKPGESLEIANWLFCNIPANAQKFNPASVKQYPTAEELRYFLTNSPSKISEKCVSDLVWNLIFTMKMMTDLTSAYWTPDTLEDDRIVALYIVTVSGLLMTYSNERNILISQLSRTILDDLTFAHPGSFYMRGLDDVIVFTVPIKTGGLPRKTNKKVEHTNTEISVGVPITVSSDRVLVGIIGMVLPSQYLQNLLLNVSKEFTCDYPSCVAYSCNDLDNLECYLLDEHGYVVASNKGEIEVGYFFGYVNGALMRAFEELSIYERKEFADKQAQCKQEIKEDSSTSEGAKLSLIFDNILTILKFIAAYLSSVCTIFLTSQIDLSVEQTTTIDTNVSCTKNLSIHTISSHYINYAGNFSCTKHCQEDFVIKAIPKTNLVLVISRNKCNGACSKFVHSNEPYKIEDLGICDESLPYRKALPTCYQLNIGSYKCKSDGRMLFTGISVYMVAVFGGFILAST
ncbi:voltage-dependent calcium channel subunit alpha-2/delta-3-like [Hydractinia symbiolongicarpus]|uniref:voltage-dependent calcium channel subunit alpha-2/delta-3-like n=1 Tax=Hydractinia symbiolongicarpus TaxID=13093 RepID=UPI00254F8DF5|nr:voltage-dependent calcium channel subunit alpha-2/delta-3-like [Hydractinia symbiolongicarpus]